MIVSELVENGDLYKFIVTKRGKSETLPIPLVRKLATDILKGLICIHSKRLMHRDLNPRNILLAGPIEWPTAKISGSLSHTLAHTPTRSFSIVNRFWSCANQYELWSAI